jgi:4-amino-4-deoxy-L-arabinose transferase-like glycosyltransferase
MAVDRRRRSVFELESLGAGKLSIDDRLIIDRRDRSTKPTTRGTAELTTGVHRIELEHVHATGSAYLRIREHDLNEPHFEYSLPPLETQRFFVDAARAESALQRGLPHRKPGRALLAFALFTAAGACGWLAYRLSTRRARVSPPPLLDFALASALSVLALCVRAARIPTQDFAWDEIAYAIAGRHMLRNLQLGDYSHDAFRWNYYHPPIGKWFYGLGWELGGHDGARFGSALLSALSVGFVYGVAKLLYGRRIAVGAGAVAVFVPGLVAHARLTGLESVLVFFWMASLLAAICWTRTAGNSAGASSFIAGATAVWAIGTRMTAVWLLPLLAVIFVHGSLRLTPRRRLSAVLLLALGAALALLLCAALWPWLSLQPIAGWHKIMDRWSSQHATEVFLGQDQRPPPIEYYVAAFAATTPALLLIAGVVGAVLGLCRRETRAPTVIVLLWLGLPFLQSLSAFRQDLARYVIQSWPALAVLAVLGAETSFTMLAARAGSIRAALGPRSRALTGVALSSVLPLYTAGCLLSVEPFPLDYFNELVGGPAGVAHSHAFELAWWGEGFRDALAYVNQRAPARSRVLLALTPDDTRPRLRDDLVAVGRRPAEYIVTNHYKFKPLAAPGCVLVHRVQVAGAPLVDVYHCDRRARHHRP